MKKLVGLLSVLCFCIPFISFGKAELLKGAYENKSYQVIKVPMDGSVRIEVAAVPSPGTPLSLKSFMDQKGGTHAINGGFFCPKGYNRCEPNTSDGLRISNGVLLSKWGKGIPEYRSVFGFDIDGKVAPMADSSQAVWNTNTYKWDNKNIDAIHNGMMMPTLIKNGINVTPFNTEMNTDTKQKKSANKTFICSTKDGDFVYMGYVSGQTFTSLPDYLIKYFQCYNAILLDNGGSKAMIFDHRYVAGPGRNIMDAFILIENKNLETDKENIISKNNTLDERNIYIKKVQLFQQTLSNTFEQKGFNFEQKNEFIKKLSIIMHYLLNKTSQTDPVYKNYKYILEAVNTYPLITDDKILDD